MGGFHTHPPPHLTEAHALFLDVDGTLLKIAPSPDQVVVPEALIDLLAVLSAQRGGALALVSGRRIDTLDRLFAPLTLDTIGLHGLEMRHVGMLSPAPMPEPALGRLKPVLADLATRFPGVWIEDKGPSIATHFRQAPGAEAAVRDIIGSFVAAQSGTLTLQPGKAVLEVRPRSADKGQGITTLAARPPFAGKIPVFIGDDLTDESGFLAVNRLGGISVRVGEPAETAARYRLDDVARVHLWLSSSAQRTETDPR